jgi:hypothetical protein
MMEITKKSMISGITRTMDLPVTRCQINLWRTGTLIQDAMPELDDDQREFIMTGITPEEWEQHQAAMCVGCDE